MAITPKQQRFIDVYVIPGTDGSLNATKAYRAAYPNCKSDDAAAVNAHKLLRNAKVREAVDARLAKLADETGMTAKEAWRESGYIARSYIGDVIDFSGIEPRLKPANQIPESALRAIKSVKVKRCVEGTGDDARTVELMEFTFWDKPGELHVRLKALGELKETVEHTGPGGGKIEAEVTIIDARKTIAAYVDEFRAAAFRNLQEASELNGHTSGDSHGV